MPFHREFPLSMRLFHYRAGRFTQGVTWHEQLELFCPITGHVDVQMGSQLVSLAAGDLLVMDNLNLHHVVDRADLDARVVVVSFLPELVYSLGSPSHDYAFLLPFYSKVERRPHILRASEGVAAAVHDALTRLLECYFAGTAQPFHQAGSKAFLLQVLYHLAGHFRASEMLKWEFMRQQERSLRLKKLFDHINARPAGKLPVNTAARLVGMSAPQFMKNFKQVAGMTLVAYLNHVRLANGARLLRETGRSIADIADATGFSDQSYFDKRFKRAFGRTPKEFRAGVTR